MELTAGVVSAARIPFIGGQLLSNYHLLFIVSAVFRLLAIVLLFKSYQENDSKEASRMVKDVFGRIKSRFSFIRLR